MVTEVQGQPQSEHIYAVLRREIVSGAIKPDQVVTSAEVSERFACAKRMAQDVLSALAADGYLKLKRKTSGYLPEHWADDEVLEMLDDLMLLHEICVLRFPGDAPEKIDELRSHRSTFEGEGSSETRLLSLLSWVGVPYDFQGLEPVGEFGAKLIPSAVVRLVWTAIESSPEIGPAMEQIERQLAKDDSRAARACVTALWTTIKRQYAEFSNGRISGATGAGDLNVREPDLAGKLPSFGRSDGFGTELLPRLDNNPRMSQKLPVEYCGT